MVHGLKYLLTLTVVADSVVACILFPLCGIRDAGHNLYVSEELPPVLAGITSNALVTFYLLATEKVEVIRVLYWSFLIRAQYKSD